MYKIQFGGSELKDSVKDSDFRATRKRSELAVGNQGIYRPVVWISGNKEVN